VTVWLVAALSVAVIVAELDPSVAVYVALLNCTVGVPSESSRRERVAVLGPPKLA
jgi:hypothetical protein